MNAPLPVAVSIPSLAMSETELISVLGSSIYPGAKVESIKLVISYCKARQLDPLQKPVHIVPMDVKTDRKKQDGGWIYEKRDVVMPGIGLYRTDAARTNVYAGKTEPEFGPDKEFRKDQFSMAYPEWCRITVYRMVGGERVGFSAKELWLENYATAGSDTSMPNKMWKKRPYAQLAKCAEAQALRMAFPEAVGAEPTADEMEGKTLDTDVVEGQVTGRGGVEQPRLTQETPTPASQTPEGSGAASTGAPANGHSEEKLTEGARQTIERALQRYGRTETDLVAAGLLNAGQKLADMAFSKMAETMKWIREHPTA